MEGKLYGLGVNVPVVGCVKLFNFKTKMPLEKYKVMDYNPEKYREFIESRKLKMVTATKWDEWKARICFFFFGKLIVDNMIIIIPEDYM